MPSCSRAERFFLAAELGQRLRRHLVRRNVVGIMPNEGGKLRQRRVGLPLAAKFHSKAIAGERIGGVELQYFVECCDLIH